jgi:hypothetical protein
MADPRTPVKATRKRGLAADTPLGPGALGPRVQPGVVPAGLRVEPLPSPPASAGGESSKGAATGSALAQPLAGPVHACAEDGAAPLGVDAGAAGMGTAVEPSSTR